MRQPDTASLWKSRPQYCLKGVAKQVEVSKALRQPRVAVHDWVSVVLAKRGHRCKLQCQLQSLLLMLLSQQSWELVQRNSHTAPARFNSAVRR
jgi:hypothetical protein